jgi:hypothetical protein
VSSKPSHRPLAAGLRLPATALVLATLLGPTSAMAQPAPVTPAEPVIADPSRDRVLLDETALSDLVGPVALYPDDLLGIVLPASTYPLQIVQAARFLEAVKADPSLEPDPSWDPAVVALLNYPEVVELLDRDLDWTWRLGEAVINQQSDVLAAVQDFRARASIAGNLQTDANQVVATSGETIIIRPANPERIYVPYYEPARVVVVQPYPVYYYYPRPYPLYYYPYPADYGYPWPYFWGVRSAYWIGWPTRYVHVYHHYHYAHPYRARTYAHYHYYYHDRGFFHDRDSYHDRDWDHRHRSFAARAYPSHPSAGRNDDRRRSDWRAPSHNAADDRWTHDRRHSGARPRQYDDDRRDGRADRHHDRGERSDRPRHATTAASSTPRFERRERDARMPTAAGSHPPQSTNRAPGAHREQRAGHDSVAPSSRAREARPTPPNDAAMISGRNPHPGGADRATRANSAPPAQAPARDPAAQGPRSRDDRPTTRPPSGTALIAGNRPLPQATTRAAAAQEQRPEIALAPRNRGLESLARASSEIARRPTLRPDPATRVPVQPDVVRASAPPPAPSHAPAPSHRERASTSTPSFAAAPPRAESRSSERRFADESRSHRGETRSDRSFDGDGGGGRGRTLGSMHRAR